jgi:hypothetical protein
MSSEPHEDWERIEHEDIDTNSETYIIPPEIGISQIFDNFYCIVGLQTDRLRRVLREKVY